MPPPRARIRLVPGCVSVVVVLRTEDGKQRKGWYGFLRKRWYEEKNGVGVEVKQKVTHWRKLKKNETE